MQYQELKFLRNFDSKTYPIIVTCCFFLIVSYVAFFHHNYWLDGDYLLYSDWGYDILSGNSKNVKLINTPSIGSVIFASLNSFTGDEFLTAKLLEKGSVEELAKSCGKTSDQVIVNGKFDPYELVDIDSVLISSRHLFRCAYSVNEKS